ncbi:MAG: ABC transporter permease [Clostridiales bacterium]|nr:ABC transporter permease [Clostridiales bacterium]
MEEINNQTNNLPENADVQLEEVTLQPEEANLQTEQTDNDSLHGENLTERVKALSPGATVAKRFFRSKLSVIGLVTIIVLFLFAFVGPWISPWGENDVDYSRAKPAVSGGIFDYEVDGEVYSGYTVVYDWTSNINDLDGVSSKHWMGTDNLGQDIFTRLMYGGRISLTLGFVVIILETILGVVLGGISGYFGGWVDNVIMRIVDLLSCIPTIPLMLIFGTALNGLGFDTMPLAQYKLYIIMGVLTLIGWVGTARLVRGQILSLREQEFMLAAKCSGLSTRSKIFKHLLPNVIPQLIVTMTLGLGGVILMEATLGFLSIGAPPEMATWGSMINFAQQLRYRQFYPNMWIGAGVCITLAILAFNFVGDGLRDAFDPKMKR